MEIEALRSFVAFVDTGSFTRAAMQTYKTQSAVSMQMKRLEQELGKTLFVKEGRNLVLSTEGQRLGLYAKQLLQLHDETVTSIKQTQVGTQLHLGCPDDYAESVLPRIVALLHGQIKQLDLQITCASSQKLRIMLDSGQLDAAIVTRLPESDEGYLLQTSKGVWVSASDSNLSDADPLPIALFQKDCKFHIAALDGLMKQDRHYQLLACSSSAAALKAIVAKDLAISAMAECSVSAPLNIIDSETLPPLPVVAVALVISAKAYSPINAELAKQIARAYQGYLE
ncbi:LysR family transcriptional regulator [Shewanella decolorationis]|uniref:LysR family transcriptional regulator n=1 Tax=Shewanella decolorationis TaxID=256839 RepID=UPI0010574C1B|nr:LysR family transcriptional regulator [Shewanella decolorationis]